MCVILVICITKLYTIRLVSIFYKLLVEIFLKLSREITQLFLLASFKGEDYKLGLCQIEENLL